MTKFVSSIYGAPEKRVPKNYVFPPENRPGKYVKGNIPVIDLHDLENNTIQQIIKAGHDFGVFQVINHGVARNLMDEVAQVFEDVFVLPPEEKSKINKEDDTNDVCKIFTSSYNFEREGTHYWRDALRHSCSPLEECIHFWPQKPENYRKTVAEYVIAVKEMGSRILELIVQGLGLGREYLKGELVNDDLTVNYYPPCPDPSLTFGLAKHVDPTYITISLQKGQVPGLQLLKDGQWLGVEPLPGAIVILIGSQLEVISNGKLKGAMHRAVTNANEARTSSAFFIKPSMDYVIEPAKPLLAQGETPLYKSYPYKDFFNVYRPILGDKDGVLETFKING